MSDGGVEGPVHWGIRHTTYCKIVVRMVEQYLYSL